jgi:hypothetical protein
LDRIRQKLTAAKSRTPLEHQVSQMDVEVDRTDTHDFKKMLQHRRDLLKSILGRLSAVTV